MKRNRIKIVLLPADEFDRMIRHVKADGKASDYGRIVIEIKNDAMTGREQVEAIGASMGARRINKPDVEQPPKAEDFGERLRRFCGGFGG